MTVSDQKATIARLQDLFYRCKFTEVLADVARHEEAEGELDAEVLLIKANTLFELHQVADARATLRSISQGKDGFDEGYLYALARLAYMDYKADEARPLFEEIHAQTTNESYKFKSLLGVANTYYSQSDFAKIPALITELHTFEPLKRDDERISLMIFLGNYYFASGASSELAKQYFKKALSTAAANTWTYFITRSLYGIAAICEKEAHANELLWTLDILQSFVDQSEQRFFAHVVNDKFKSHFSINTPMEFDTANRRIMLKDRWLPFHDRPLLFQFLLVLHMNGNFVDKEALAKELWPEEGYKPRVHDPRIFDIAKRARNLIEGYEHQPVVLLSGRMGYKLAST